MHEYQEFLDTLWEFYAQHGRAGLPWRQPEADGSFDPYKIMVSELMLQQTQVGRVIPKYHEFLERFPDVAALAAADLGDVLRAWQGLGYNRRAKFLWLAARQITEQSNLPADLPGLVALPGIGPNTAGAILAYAYNQPVVFIETNVRTVYIHHFFADQSGVHDKEILDVLSQTVPWRKGKEQSDKKSRLFAGAMDGVPTKPVLWGKGKTVGLSHIHPREFYWALMDYGSHLKQTVGNPNRASRHYAKQSQFQGSQRQIRGAVIRLLGNGPLSREELAEHIPDSRLPLVLTQLVAESMVSEAEGTYRL